MRRRKIVLMALILMNLAALAQRVSVSGIVKDTQTGERLSQVNVSAAGISVVTNEDGLFTLKLPDRVESVTVSHVGYHTQKVRVPQDQESPLDIRLKPATIQLDEVVVWTTDPRQLISIAMSKIPENYSNTAELMECFYRETAMKRQHYIAVAEGVVDMYKTSYKRGTGRDRVAIRKGRRLLSPKRGDTLTVKVLGGPVQPVQLDFVKNREFLLNVEELSYYDFKLLPSEMIDDREQFVVAISPLIPQPYAGYPRVESESRKHAASLPRPPFPRAGSLS